MKHNSERLNYLIKRYFDQAITGTEEQELWAYVEDPNYAGQIEALLPEAYDRQAEAPATGLDSPRKQAILAHIFQQDMIPARHRRLWPRIAAAAAILLIFGTGGYFYLHQDKPLQMAAIQPEALKPVQQGITLTLANGKHIVIDQKHHGKIKTEDGAQADQSGEALAYAAQAGAAPVMQTLTNNSGNKFTLQLADGTDVYLDARSSITYPTAFTGKERQVSVTGQAYFKVKHNAGQPFFVTAKNETVEDIGTEFNINAYDEESVLKTTLVEGSVKINHTLILQPGEQAQYGDNELKAVPADIEAVTAWLQGKMVFHHEPLESILTKVSRIYDVKIIWLDEALKKHKFGGSVSRTKQLATVLNFFRNTGEVDFLVEGKTVKVFKPKKK